MTGQVNDSHSHAFDVAVIGAGVVGAAIARELTRHRLRCLLLDAADDVGTGTSKANTAILHTGFDAKPGTLEARLVRRGYELLSEYAPRAGIALEPLGALLVAWDEEQLAALPRIVDDAHRNGVQAIAGIDAADLYRREPHLGPGARGALEIPGESIICPFTTPLAFATEAVVNGCTLALSRAVDGVERRDGAWQLRAGGETFAACFVVNAAGLYADRIDALFGRRDFSVTPRRGELIVFDKLARPLVRHIVLQVPTKVSKGVLVSPTVFGNLMLGPTADDIADRTATGATSAGIASLLERGRRILPSLLEEEVTAVYVGLRSATEHADYQIRFHPDLAYACAGGIRSTGLTASMAIAEHVAAGLGDMGLRLEPRDDFRRVRMPSIGEAARRPYQDAERIAADGDCGRIACHCERVSRREILDALRAPIPARGLDGVRRRTRALLGRCQGFFCLAEVASLVSEATGESVEELLGVTEERGVRGLGVKGLGEEHSRYFPNPLTPNPLTPSKTTTDALIIGGGPSGLAAAIELRRLGVARVTVVDREAEMGGVPRHCDHIGFGMRDLHRLLGGPGYARCYARLAHDAGVMLRTATTATAWLSPTAARLTSAGGIEEVEARTIILATGCRERPRSARLVPGDRPLGVFTTGSLQQLAARGVRVGRQAVVVGAEHVSFSAVLTLAHAGARTVAMITEHARHQTYAPYKWLSSDRLRVSILTGKRLGRIIGRGRVEAVELIDVDGGEVRRLDCDTVVFTGDWIPDHELARRGGLMMDPATRAPIVDGALRTSARGMFAAGNLVHAAETADVAALGGRHAARAAARFLETGEWPTEVPVTIECEPPVHWVAPSAVRPGAPPALGRFTWRVSRLCRNAEVTVSQGERVLWHRRYRELVPTLPLDTPANWIDTVDPSGPPLRWRLG